EEFNIDGYRFDLSKGFTQTNTLGNTNLWGQYDASRIAIWNDYDEFIHSVDEDAYVILEHFADNNEERELSNNNMMLWGNLNHNYCEASMGWNSNSDFSWIDYQDRGWSNPYLVGYMESHDEERQVFKNVTYGNSNGSYNIQDSAIAVDRMKLTSTFFIPIAGPKMIWMFGELGYDYSIDFNGRTGIKPTRWDYYDDWRRRFVYNNYSALINLKNDYKHIFNQPDYDLNVAGAVKTILINHSEMNVFIVGNFDVIDQSTSLNFQHTGMWYDFMTGDSINVESMPYDLDIEAGEYRLYTDVKIDSPLIQGIEDEVNNSGVSLNVYPNPVSENINLDLYLKDNSDIEIGIVDMQGKEVVVIPEQTLPGGMHSMSWSVDTLGLSSGLHFVIVKNGNYNSMKKIIIR
ncbi:MAG: alpha-amylase, partial [Marinilabiliales bacterium]